MKRRNILYGFLALSLLSASILTAVSSTNSKNVSVVWGETNFKNSYSIGSTIFVPDLEATIDGENILIKPKIVFPSKKVIYKHSAELNEIGQYSVVYETIYKEKAYSNQSTFKVKSNFFDLGLASSSYYGRPENAKEHNGLVFKLAQGDEIFFNKSIDIHDFTSEDFIISGYIAPETMGQYDFEKLIITMYDSENPDIWYKQHIRRRDMVSTSGINPIGRAYYYGGGNGQGTAGANVKETDPQDINKNNEWGPMSLLPFDGVYNIIYYDGGEKVSEFKNNPVDDYLFRISMDMKGYEVYTTEYQRDRNANFVEGPQKVVKHFITDLDNPNFYPVLFNGFPSGKIKIGISADMYNKEYAQFVITDIAGLNLNETILNDSEGPNLEIDIAESNIPLAQAGYSYLIPEASAVDEICGKANVNVSVWFNYGSEKQQQIPIKNNRFNTDKVGWYTIEYIAYDSFYNATIKTVSVYCGKTIPDLKINIYEHQQEMYVGQYLKAASFDVENSSGPYETKISFIDPLGNEHESINNFVVEYHGEWQVKYSVIDMIGRTKSETYSLNASFSDGPILRENSLLTLPKALIGGGTYNFPSLNAVQYYDDEDYDEFTCDLNVKYEGVDEIVEVDDVLEVSNYLDNGINVNCKYECEGVTLYEENIPYVSGLRYDETSEEYPIKLNLLNYYLSNNFDFSQSDDLEDKNGIRATVKTDSSESGFIFANALLSDRFSINLKTYAGSTNYSGFNIKLIDFEDKDNSVTSKVLFNNYGARMTVDGVSKDININKFSNNEFSLSYLDGKLSFEDVISTDFDIIHRDNGMLFEGFASHKVYVEITLIDAKSNDIINVVKINNHFMYKNKEDIDDTVPQYVFIGNHGGSYSQNEVYSSPKFIAGDVIAPNVETSLRISSPSTTLGNNLDPSQSYDILLDELGTYTFAFKAQETYANDDFTDADARPINIKDNVYVIDDVPPTITLTSTMVSEGKIGDIVAISGFTATDNKDSEESIIKTRMIIAPNGLVKIIDDTIEGLKLTMKGTYVVRYMAQDSYGNLTVLDHYIYVK